MTEADNLAEIVEHLRAGTCSQVEQLSLSLRLALSVPRVREMERFRDEIVREAQEEARAAEYEAMLREQGAGPPSNVVKLTRRVHFVSVR